LILSSLTPVFMLIIFYLLSLPYMIYTKMKMKVEMLIFISEFLYFYIISSLSVELISFFSCRMIGEYYLKSNLLQTCFSKEHLDFFMPIVLPITVFYLIIFPITAFLKLKKSKDKLFKIRTIISSGNSFLDYKYTVYYFEYIRL
jgi:hypothetical protein